MIIFISGARRDSMEDDFGEPINFDLAIPTFFGMYIYSYPEVYREIL